MTNQEAKRAAQPEAVPPSAAGLPKPPVAIRKPEEHVIHGDVRRDDYGWLRKKSDAAVIAYLSEENAYTDAVMKGTEQLQESLYQEMLGRILQTDLSVPFRLRGYDYFTRTEEGKQYPMHARRAVNTAGSERDADNAPEELLLDLNVFAEGHSFLGLGSFDVSDDNNMLAYSIDVTGFRQYTLYVKSLRTGETFAERIDRVTSAAWAADNHTIFYTVEDETTKRSHRLYRHLVAAGEPDILLYEEKDERFRIEVERTRSAAFLILTSASHTTCEVRYLAADDSLGTFRLMAPREEEHEYYVEHHPAESANASGGEFYIRTNSSGRTFRLMKAPVDECGRENWREIVPNRPEVMLSGVDVFSTHVVLTEREQGLPHLRVAQIPLGDLLRNSYRLEFSEPTYNAALGANPEFQTGHLRFIYESFVTPRSVFDFDLQTRERLLRKQQPVLSGYDPAKYASERVHAKAADNTLIPISLVYRRDALRKTQQAATNSGIAHTSGNGTAPLLLYGYGSYGISIPISFSSNRLSLLDRGIIFAIAHIRGGGELGKPWHDAGRMNKKLSTFTDFISAGEFLISEGYAAADKLLIEGGSAGGLLMGAVTNLRPDLFRLVISHVPFVDVLNTMLDASLPLTVGEYEEWGNPQVAEDYFYMKGYCPYTNSRAGKYPTMLLKTGLNDSQVMYWEPAKYVAKLRAIKTDGNPLLLKTNMGAGHGGASGRYDYLREIAFDYAFILTQLHLTQVGQRA